ncbi:unnamed protein product [Phytophthora lilii]|uniref:RxLR effector protein n=1 Tax=Phytophthora lilii TaxID=2077276 RepID=A0A9W6WH60_9STRA|nr:unnamed protein product [Phytophthora lilii]
MRLTFALLTSTPVSLCATGNATSDFDQATISPIVSPDQVDVVDVVFDAKRFLRRHKSVEEDGAEDDDGLDDISDDRNLHSSRGARNC